MLFDLKPMNAVAQQFVTLAGQYGVGCLALRMRTHQEGVVRILGAGLVSPADASFFQTYLRDHGFSAKLDSRHRQRQHVIFCPDARVGGKL